jgi:hypothetical protein
MHAQRLPIVESPSSSLVSGSLLVEREKIREMWISKGEGVVLCDVLYSGSAIKGHSWTLTAVAPGCIGPKY